LRGGSVDFRKRVVELSGVGQLLGARQPFVGRELGRGALAWRRAEGILRLVAGRCFDGEPFEIDRGSDLVLQRLGETCTDAPRSYLGSPAFRIRWRFLNDAVEQCPRAHGVTGALERNGRLDQRRGVRASGEKPGRLFVWPNLETRFGAIPRNLDAKQRQVGLEPFEQRQRSFEVA
jgi:hypothetical protein